MSNGQNPIRAGLIQQCPMVRTPLELSRLSDIPQYTQHSDNNNRIICNLSDLSEPNSPSLKRQPFDMDNHSQATPPTTAVSVTEIVHYNELVLEMNFFLNTIIIHIVCLFGVLGNTFTLVVLTQHGFKDATNILLLSLAASDLVFSVTTSMSYMYNIVKIFDMDFASSMYAVYVTHILPVHGLSSVASFISVAVISVERFIAVWFPFHSTRIVTPKRMKIVVVSVYVYLTILILPDIFCYQFGWYFHPLQNRTFAQVYKTKFYEENEDVLEFYFWMFRNNFTSTLPLAIVIVCTTMIVAKLISSSKKRKLMTSHHVTANKVKDKRVVKMLMVVSLTYIAILLPTTIMDLYMAIADPARIVINVLVFIQNLLYQINASVNFVIYVTTSSKFYQTYKNIFLHCSCCK
ncbi:endothelin receptor type B-like [Physella acuta]|uniref:endothelin receptor type B-like n=1 Tax=Physella acuta TaxID=109671 RepID=UPI0027DC87FC|nr:endothelin receptor type B-like [Physella acuta]